ncbi:MAG: hypothetical protein V1766_11020 [Pseudomonadota bacterium]
MSEPVLSTAGPEAERKLPPVEEVKDAISDFLKKMVGAKKVSVTKMVLLDSEKETWEADADVYVPNPTIRALGLPVQKEVLDCQTYLLRLDMQLNIVAYERRDSATDRDSVIEREDIE